MSNEALVLHRRMRLLQPDALHCREVELRLAEDGSHVLLNHYVELYRHQRLGWCALRQHRVPLAAIVRWMIDNGEQMRG
ncbi:hypothetical protein HU715_012740 [Pseudomonas sp. SWRI12]|uniref:Uncharacterized protein n=1 Tax=Pseudomonas zanjanensis TaxID=2745496 RepID=A0A923FJ75_9PSED|nr:MULTISPECIES: hypothetical protein [Pseudomonas]MBC3384928.1 hypothetical protein [Pseudomonas sp. SWRI179]MBV4496231.1 hypothetical protein [Pseudomonas zanjanensis]